MAEDAALFVGIDVGKYQVDVAVGANGPVQRFPNDDDGIEGVLKLLAGQRIALVVMEANGGWVSTTAACIDAGEEAARIGGQSTAGARFRKSDRETGENRRSRRANAGAVRRAHPPACTGTTRRDSRASLRLAGAPSPTRRDAGRREEPTPPSKGRHSPEHRKPHHMAQIAAPRHRERSLGHDVGLPVLECRRRVARRSAWHRQTRGDHPDGGHPRARNVGS
jgi:hypothetical protein